jgi:hypothetical protein
MVYGTEDANGIDKAVRLVILLIMVVFDPLAVLLLIAANMSLQQRSRVVINKENEIIKIVPDITTQNVEVANDKIEIPKENITKIEEQPIVIDEVTGETIPPLTVHVVPGVYEEHHNVEQPAEHPKKLEPKYDYDAEFAFREKSNTATKLDGGDF